MKESADAEKRERSEEGENPGGAESLIGRTLGGYRIDGLLGHGSMGTVYRATQLSVERSVALKVLAPTLARNRKFVIGFVAEARAAARLNHPQVVQIHDVAQADRYLFYSMEYLPGGSLAAHLRAEGRVPWRQLIPMFRDAARALLYGEQNRIVHGAISPDSLLLTADRRVKVADLGITMDLRRMLGEESKRAGGALLHLAPEQAPGRKTDHRSDMYALGSTFLHALCGSPPSRDGAREKAGAGAREKAGAGSPTPAEAGSPPPPETPAWLHTLLLKLAARDPAARPQSFAEVIQALEGRGQERAGAPGETAGAPGILGTARRRIAAGAAAAVLLLGMLSLFLLPGSPGEAPSGKEGGTIAGAGDGKERPEAVARPGDPTATPGGEEARPAVASGERTTVASPGPAAPPAPPDGERQARLRELEEVLKNWRADLLTAAEAEQAIEKLKGQSADAAMVAAAASALKEVESSRNAAVTREGEASERVLQKFVAEKVAPEVQAERFGEAVKILQELALKFPGSKAAIDLEIGKVVEAAGAALKAAQAEAAAFSGAGEFARAADRMREVEPRLPAVLREEAIKTITAATEAEARFKASEAEVRKAAEKVAAHLVALDFVAAAAAAAGIPETPAPPLAARGQWLAEEVDLFREAWEKLLSGVERSRGKELALAFHSPAPGDGDARAAATLRLKESSREGNAVLLTLQAGSAARSEKRDLLALDDAALAHFLEPAAPAPGGEGAASPAAALPPRSREGLGLVLLHLEGPARSAPHLLENTTLGEEKRKHYAARIAEVAGLHLPARLAEAKAQLEEAAAAAAAGPPAPEEAALIADRLQRLIAAHRGYPGYAKVRGELAAVALEALKQYLRPRGTDDLFHARSVRRSETKLELVYDFNTEAELEDFTPVGPGSARVLERKALKLRGEFRLVRGDPFRNWLSVKAEVSRYNPAQPNINVALWTQENDQVTYDRARLLRSPNRPPAPDTAAGEDYLVFAVGYQPQGAESLVLSAIGSGLIAPTPCFAVLGGARGKMLHGDGTYKSLWSESTLNKVQGPQMIQLLLKPDAFDWYVNRTRLSTRAYEKEPSLLKSLFRSGATGSVSLFTNGEWIHFESLKVEGEPNPGWVEAELERRAVQELKKIEPDYPFRK